MSALQALIPFLLFTLVLEGAQLLFSFLLDLIVSAGSGTLFVFCMQHPGDANAIATALSYLAAFLIVLSFVKEDLVWTKKRYQAMEQAGTLQLSMEKAEKDAEDPNKEDQEKREQERIRRWKIDTPYLVLPEYRLLAGILLSLCAMLLSLGIQEVYALSGILEGGTDLSGLSPALSAAVYGLFTPFVEEMVFRVSTYGRLLQKTRGSVPVCMLFSALLFGLFHGNLPQGVYAMLMGFLFVLAIEITGEFVTAFFMHSLCNLASLFLSFQGIAVSLPAALLFLLAGFLGLAAVLLLCRRVRIDAWKSR